MTTKDWNKNAIDGTIPLINNKDSKIIGFIAIDEESGRAGLFTTSDASKETYISVLRKISDDLEKEGSEITHSIRKV